MYKNHFYKEFKVIWCKLSIFETEYELTCVTCSFSGVYGVESNLEAENMGLSSDSAHPKYVVLAGLLTKPNFLMYQVQTVM